MTYRVDQSRGVTQPSETTTDKAEKKGSLAGRAVSTALKKLQAIAKKIGDAFASIGKPKTEAAPVNEPEIEVSHPFNVVQPLNVKPIETGDSPEVARIKQAINNTTQVSDLLDNKADMDHISSAQEKVFPDKHSQFTKSLDFVGRLTKEIKSMKKEKSESGIDDITPPKFFTSREEIKEYIEFLKPFVKPDNHQLLDFQVNKLFNSQSNKVVNCENHIKFMKEIMNSVNEGLMEEIKGSFSTATPKTEAVAVKPKTEAAAIKQPQEAIEFIIKLSGKIEAMAKVPVGELRHEIINPNIFLPNVDYMEMIGPFVKESERGKLKELLEKLQNAGKFVVRDDYQANMEAVMKLVNEGFKKVRP